MTDGKVFLGFEVKTGKEVWLSVHHLAIFGMTQLSKYRLPSKLKIESHKE